MKTMIADISEKGALLNDEQLLAVAGGVKEIHRPSERDPNDATSTGTHDHSRQMSRWDGDCEVGPCMGSR